MTQKHINMKMILQSLKDEGADKATVNSTINTLRKVIPDDEVIFYYGMVFGEQIHLEEHE